MYHCVRSCTIACGHAPLRAVCIAAVCKLPTDLASRWWFLRCRRLVAAARRRQRRRGRAEPRARGHTSLRSALRAVMHRARSCIIACGHASMRYVSSLLTQLTGGGPAGGSSQQPIPDGSSQQPLLDGSVARAYAAITLLRAVIASMRGHASWLCRRQHARCGCPRAGREARAKAAP